MSSELLGNHFDIHGGGQDLQFPHHENEIAQSEGANQAKFVNYWMHNGFVRVDNEKMSKSLGNFFTVREVLARYDAEVVRFFIVRAHYRSPLNYSDQHLDDAKHALTRLYTALKGVDAAGGRGRLERRARAALPRGDERRLQHAGSGRGAVRSRERAQQERARRRTRAAEVAWRRSSACCSASQCVPARHVLLAARRPSSGTDRRASGDCSALRRSRLSS